MQDELFRIRSISQLCEMAGFGKPTHPLIHIADVSQWAIDREQVGVRYSLDLYTIALKDKSCGMIYGRHSYDFDEGVMIFTGPDQVTSTTREQRFNEVQGWMLFFHPDLIRGTGLGNAIDRYGFFSYDVNEALHLSEKEQEIVTGLVDRIQEEINGRIDSHSNRVIVSGIELLLNYSLRYYERQFNTRSAQNKDFVARIDGWLKHHFDEGLFAETGIPDAAYFAEKMHLSPRYLSDLLKKETGRSLKEHISAFIVDRAKTLLLGSDRSVSEIAFQLGFNYPHYFSRLFRSKTGVSPREYRVRR